MSAVTTVVKPNAPGLGSPESGLRQHSLSYIPALDGIRGVALIMVLLAHWSQSILTIPIHGYMRHMATTMALACHTGLDLFFVLSGFLITRILLSIKSKPMGIPNFLVRRALKIFPLYYLTLTVVAFLPAAFRHTALRMDATDTGWIWPWVFGQNIAIVHYHQFLYGALDHFWSIAVEEHFYWIWPAVVIFLSMRNAACVAVGLVGLSILSRSWFLIGHQDPIACEFLTICRLDGLAIGALIAIAESKNLLKPQYSGLLASLFIAGLAASVGVHHGWFGSSLSPAASVLLKTFESISFAGIISLVVIHKDGLLGKIFASPILTFFGIYSYSIFVFHHFLRPPFLPVTILYGANKPNNAAVTYGLVHFAISVVLGVISFHLYEKHFLKLKAKFPSVNLNKDTE
jgi:peptidoglycan/LPS O-acetylase OafA/YrhL